MKYLIANWKMNMTEKNIAEFFDKFPLSKKGNSDVKTIFLPSYPHLEIVSDLLGNEFCGAQNVFMETRGAFTGQVSISQVKDFCNYCLVGHSETKESLEIYLKKAQLLLENGITPIVCFKNKEDFIKFAFEGFINVLEDPEHISENGVFVPTNAYDVAKDVAFIKQSKTLPVIYGGSVNRQNAQELVNIADVDGFLVGKASTDPTHFLDILEVL